MFYLEQLEFICAIYFIGMWSVCISTEDKDEDTLFNANWLHFVDDAGNTHILNFSFLSINTDDFLYGDAYFSLYTRKNTHDPEKLLIPAKNSKFNSIYLDDSNPVIAITHGWFSDDKVAWLQTIKDSILKKTDINVITVDWGELSKNPLYHWAAMSTRYVGKKLAKLIDEITKSYRVKGEDVYLVGHSLGAHVMGYTGMFSNQRIQRITGLDPARPLFEVPLMPPDFRLERSDADFVDIIHTSSGVLGYKLSQGHADFYPNNGTTPQPGCHGILDIVQSCSHGRSCIYFEESIGYEPPKGFVAYPCRNWENDKCNCRNNTKLMGYSLTTDATGDYYLRTKNESKFAIYDE